MFDLVSTKWLLILACAAGWTTFFSLFSNPGIRGYRNLGWLTCFVIGVVMLFVLPWRSALVTWGSIGAGSGLLYYCYGLYSRLTAKPEEEVAWPSPATIVHGLFVWPIMLPEAIEYWLADLGLLRSRATSQQDSA